MSTSTALATNEQAAALAQVDGGSMSAFDGSDESFATAQRKAKAISQSSLVPKEYQNSIANCLIAMELAHRTGASVLSVIQNLDIIHGRPSWRSTFLIGAVNASGRFSPLRFRFVGEEGTDEWGCRAMAKDLRDGEELVGTLVTIGIAKTEGWFSKSGSKWKTIPEQMLRYRAAAWWSRVYAPEISLGMHSSDEVVEYLPAVGHVSDLDAALREAEQANVPLTEDDAAHLQAIPVEDDLHAITVELRHGAGQEANWHRLNRTFIADLRRQLLGWRKLTAPQMIEYIERGSTLLASSKSAEDLKPST